MPLRSEEAYDFPRQTSNRACLLQVPLPPPPPSLLYRRHERSLKLKHECSCCVRETSSKFRLLDRQEVTGLSFPLLSSKIQIEMGSLTCSCWQWHANGLQSTLGMQYCSMENVSSFSVSWSSRSDTP